MGKSTGFKEFKAAQIILAGIEVIKYDQKGSNIET